jgi:hypothetical protein
LCNRFQAFLKSPLLQEAIECGFYQATDPISAGKPSNREVQNTIISLHQRQREWDWRGHASFPKPPLKDATIVALGLRVCEYWMGVFSPSLMLEQVLETMISYTQTQPGEAELEVEDNAAHVRKWIMEVFEDIYGWPRLLRWRRQWHQVVGQRFLVEKAKEKYAMTEFSLEDFADELGRLGLRGSVLHEHCVRKVHMRGCWFVDSLMTEGARDRNWSCM